MRRWKAQWDGVTIRVVYASGKRVGRGRARLVANRRKLDEARAPILMGGDTFVLGAPILVSGRPFTLLAVIGPAIVSSSRAPFCHMVMEGKLIGGDTDRTLRCGDPDQWKRDGSLRTLLLSGVGGAVGLGVAALVFKIAYPNVPIGLAFAGGALFGLSIGAERYLRGTWFLAQTRGRLDRQPEVVA
jgi:hypothetical protein